MLQAWSKHYRPNRLGRVLFMGARGRFAFGRSRPRPSVRKGCLRLAQSGRREAGSMAAPAGKLTTTAPFFIGGILRRKEDTKVDHPVLTPAGGEKRTLLLVGTQGRGPPRMNYGRRGLPRRQRPHPKLSRGP